MNVLLVRTRPSPETIGLQHLMRVEPLELEIMAALVPAGDRVSIVDLALETEPLETFLTRERPDVLGVTGYLTNVPEMIAACRVAKRVLPAVATVVGGVHVEVCPGDLADEAVDYRVVRNAVTALPRLLDGIRGSGDMPPGVLRCGDDPEDVPPPARDFQYVPPRRDLVDRYRGRYFYVFHEHVALIKTAFGCPHACRFCF